ncbi:alpha pinene synthase, chloroplastic-like [Cryptomeria japonica]|uniref:alpha pinene synthase, chloroplastic-like n=1 Tax=Cryptomeria japonica TaxID=3369 RepID=UPI0027DA383C|nr:alpha pinene synthase, chloroplastic-like [Cryptomeria japonica]
MALFSVSPSVLSSCLKSPPNHHVKLSNTSLPSLSRRRLNSFINKASITSAETPIRRTGNHHPNLWDDDIIKTIQEHQYEDSHYKERAERLIAEIKDMFNEMPTAKSGKSCAENAFEHLVMVDKVQRLGIDRHFQNEITQALDYVYSYWNDCPKDLNTAALGLRILRLNRYPVSADVLRHFKGNDGQFLCPSSLSEEEKIGSILNLYRASLIAFPEENIMDEAKAFAATYLNQALEKNNISSHLLREIKYNLEYGWHGNLPRVEARNYMDIYGENRSWTELADNKEILNLAKLDFNIMQSVHRRELEPILRWWKDLDLDKVEFARHRHVEYFALACAYAIDDKYSVYRSDFAKLCALTTIVDDVYDTYGTIDEIKLFNEAVKRWDPLPPKSFPENIKIAYKAFHMGVNESAQAAEKTQGRDTLPYTLKVWEAYLNALTKEAQWIVDGYIPSLEEYLENGVPSSAYRVTMLQPILTLDAVLSDDIIQEIDYPSKFNELLCLSLRLKGDTRTFKAEANRGELVSCISCYIKDHPESTEEEALDYLKELLQKRLKELDWEYLKPDNVPTISKDYAYNIGRSYQLLYKERDGFTNSNKDIKDLVTQLLLEPVAM